MNNETYNGWSNYATWRIALEIFDGVDVRDITTSTDARSVEESLKDYIEEIIYSENTGRLVESYAFAFLEQANMREIAEHMLSMLEES